MSLVTGPHKRVSDGLICHNCHPCRIFGNGAASLSHEKLRFFRGSCPGVFVWGHLAINFAGPHLPTPEWGTKPLPLDLGRGIRQESQQAQPFPPPPCAWFQDTHCHAAVSPAAHTGRKPGLCSACMEWACWALTKSCTRFSMSCLGWVSRGRPRRPNLVLMFSTVKHVTLPKSRIYHQDPLGLGIPRYHSQCLDVE